MEGTGCGGRGFGSLCGPLAVCLSLSLFLRLPYLWSPALDLSRRRWGCVCVCVCVTVLCVCVWVLCARAGGGPSGCLRGCVEGWGWGRAGGCGCGGGWGRGPAQKCLRPAKGAPDREHRSE